MTVVLPRSIVAALACVAACVGSAAANAAEGDRLRARPRLDLAALPASALPGASVTQGFGARSDVAAAGPGIVATYQRTFTYPGSVPKPPYAFVDEELFAASSLSVAANKFAKLERDSRTPPGLASLESVIYDAYLTTVILPVSSRPEGRFAPHLGDGATEILFAAHSGCCTFEAAVVLIRVRTTVAVIFAGSEGSTSRTGAGSTLDRNLLARLTAQAARALAARS
jgi:hypothetical protein